MFYDATLFHFGRAFLCFGLFLSFLSLPNREGGDSLYASQWERALSLIVNEAAGALSKGTLLDFPDCRQNAVPQHFSLSPSSGRAITCEGRNGWGGRAEPTET